MGKELRELAPGSLLYTNVVVVGLQLGIAFGPVKKTLDHVGIPVVVAGGVCPVRCRSPKNAGAYGAVLGSAIYSGKINMSDCLRYVVENVVSHERLPKTLSQ
jgi:phosphoribosylformimino-5-aminoimidazole carboxamide ribotide isomerase